MSGEEGPAGYFKEAASWDADRVAQAARLAKLAWWAAAAGWLCALVAGVCLALLLPLKSVEPFVVRVDNSTGVVDVVPVYAGGAGLDDSVTRYFLVHYITVCERFNLATAEEDYEECGAFHAPRRNQLWYAQWNPANPASPLNVHKDGSSVHVQVGSVSFFRRGSGVADLAQVRYLKAQRSAQGGAERISPYIATIQYAYTDPSQDPKLRRWNPLGFKVIELTSEAETATAPGTGPSAPSGPKEGS